MRLFRNVRLFLPALLVSVTAASMQAQFSVSIHVNLAPPMLPVYEQPMCPQPNLMWTPGYWAYSNSDGDYYWVPGAWVPAPYMGAMWTPPYWGYNGGSYEYHGGYWGRHVGFYGGVNYGFGFGGIGFAGGEWRGGSFAYNTAVVSVNETIIHTTYVDRTVVEAGIVANPRHVAYNGGPGGIQHSATPAEQAADHEQHSPPTEFQSQHETTARADKTSFAKANGGHPANPASRPQIAQKAAPAAQMKKETRPAEKAGPKAEVQPHAMPAAARAQARPESNLASNPKVRQQPAPHAAPGGHDALTKQPAPEKHAAPAPKERPKNASNDSGKDR